MTLQKDYEELVARGVEFDKPPRQRPWGAEAVSHDPDGNQLVLHQDGLSLKAMHPFSPLLPEHARRVRG